MTPKNLTESCANVWQVSPVRKQPYIACYANFMAHKPQSNTLSSDPLERILARRGEFLRFLEKRVDSPVTAEDILQSAFLKGVEKRSTIRDEESAVAWFYRLLRNAVIDHYRSQASGSRVLEAWPENLDVPGEPVEFAKNEICRCVAGLLNDLKPEYREALRLVDIEDRPIKDLAERRGITPNNATVRVHRAREALRQQVKLTCGSCAEHQCVDCRCKHS